MVLAEPTPPSPALTYLQRAAYYAARSEHGIYKMGAIVIGDRKVQAFGWNKNKTHPRALNYTRKIHAELAALIGERWHGAISLLNMDMYVVRLTNGGKLATSKPCRDCMILIKEAGIKSVTFIDEGGNICTLKL
jgi:deoxycytidylate deaminase